MVNDFLPLPVVDSHVHFAHPERMDELLRLLEEAGCARVNLVCVPERDGSTHNPHALLFKRRYPDRSYICGALDYRPVLADPGRGARMLRGQVQDLKSQGFDGLKLIEGKPEVRKLLPYPLDGALYEEMWSWLEAARFPVVFHLADPDEFWDPVRCPDWARQSGWDYSDGSYPAKEDLYLEVDHILARFPRLKIVLAHFAFLAGDLDRAARFLEVHPDISFDLAPHMGMYHDFNRQPQVTGAFFLRFQDRILYGTDTDTRTLQRGATGVGFSRFIPRLIRSFLEREGDFTIPGYGEVHGLGLPHEILEKIYHTNFQQIFGATPAPLRRSNGA